MNLLSTCHYLLAVDCVILSLQNEYGGEVIYTFKCTCKDTNGTCSDGTFIVYSLDISNKVSKDS